MSDLPELPPLPETSFLGDDASYGYDANDMRAYALAAVAMEREACAKVCEVLESQFGGGGPLPSFVLVDAAAIIRARG